MYVYVSKSYRWLLLCQVIDCDRQESVWLDAESTTREETRIIRFLNTYLPYIHAYIYIYIYVYTIHIIFHKFLQDLIMLYTRSILPYITIVKILWLLSLLWLFLYLYPISRYTHTHTHFFHRYFYNLVLLYTRSILLYYMIVKIKKYFNDFTILMIVLDYTYLHKLHTYVHVWFYPKYISTISFGCMKDQFYYFILLLFLWL